jgi:hypothetical protein
MTLPGAVVDPNPPADLDEALERAVVAPVFLAEITCGLSLPVWRQLIGTLYSTPCVDEVHSVSVNGTALTKASATTLIDALTEVITTPGEWWWDRSAKVLWMQLPDSGDPNDPAYSVEALLIYRLSDVPTDVGGYAWDIRIDDLPGLSSRIPDSFKGVSQVGGGRLGLKNEDNFFDAEYNASPGDGIYTSAVSMPGRLRQNWSAGTTTLYMGAASMPLNAFEVLGTLANGGLAVEEGGAILDLREAKALMDKPYPFAVYTRDEFPAMREQDEGRAVQVAFGRILGVNPVCINTLTREFKVAGHPIRSFDGVRVKDNELGVWVEVDFLHVDEPNGIFTLDAADWSDGQDVAVDFSGWVRDNGLMADNPAEYAIALLNDLGQAYNAAALEEARLWYDMGYYSFNEDRRYTIHSPSLYLDTQASALETLEEMCRHIRAYLVVNALGEIELKPFRNYQASELPLVRDEVDTLDAGLKREPHSTQTRVSKAVVYYALRPQEDIRSVETYEVPANQYKRRGLTPVVETVEAPFTDQRDAQWLAQCLVNEHRVDPATYTMTAKWRFWRLRVGQHIHMISERRGLDVVMEILGVSLNLKARTVALTLGNLRGFEEAAGFWTDDADETPMGDDLSWPAGGQVPGDESQYKRHQTGIWHNDLDMATDTPLTAQDRAVSLWQ